MNRPSRKPRIGVTLGDPRGIGPEITALALKDHWVSQAADFVLIGPAGLGDSQLELESVGVWEAGAGAAEAGRLAGLAIERAVDMCLVGELAAMVTAPIHKAAFHAGGWNFPGHTEMLQELAGADDVSMMMAAETTRLGGALRVVLATTHLPLREVPAALTADLLFRQTSVTAAALREWWGIDTPRIALCAFNPHASDGGLFGDEEARIYAPAIDRLRSEGLVIAAPMPADTVFGRALSGEFDVVIAPYHDVGMAPFKTVSFGTGVNVTLGLPFPRTSPDHGTALDIAGKGLANPSSMVEALRLAIRLANRFDTLSPAA